MRKADAARWSLRTGATGPPGTAGTTAATVTATETTTSTTYTDLATPGPSVTVTIPASGKALVIVTSAETGSTGSGIAYMSYAVSGATTVAAVDGRALQVQGSNFTRASATSITGLTPGSNTFTAKYRISGGTGTWRDRDIVVIPLP